MQVKFVYDSDLCWHTEKVETVQDNVSHTDIQAMFPIVLGVTYNKNDCYYEAIDGQHIFTDSEILAYSD
jgi:hypothetical protein